MSWQLLTAAPRNHNRQPSRPLAAAAVTAPAAVSGPAGFQRLGCADRPLTSSTSTTATADASAGRAPLSSSLPTGRKSRRVNASPAAAATDVPCAPCAPCAVPSVPWTEKHAPHCLEDLGLAVQCKKAREVQDWLEHQLPGTFRREYCRLMIVTGVGEGSTDILSAWSTLPIVRLLQSIIA
jgi:hypothetical protein